MANSVDLGSVYARLILDTQPFESSVRSAESQFRNMGDNLQSQGRSFGSSLSKTFSKIGDVLETGLTNGAVIAGGAVATLGIKGVISGNQLQQLQLQMNGLTKSMELGAKAMAGAYEYAQKSPFQLPDVASTTKTLLAYGMTVDQAVGSLELLGNISITTGVGLQSLGSIFGRVSANSKLMLGDIRQLTDNGVAIMPQLQKQFGKTAEEVEDMAMRGEIGFEDFKKAMAALVDPSILEQLNNTLPRQFDRLMGSVRKLSNAFIGVSVDATNGFVMASNGILQATTTLTKQLADTMRSPALLESFTGLGNALVPLITKITQLITPIANGITSLINAFVGLGANALPILGFIVGSMGMFLSQIPVIGGLFAGLTGPIGLVLGLLATLITKSPELRAAFSTAFEIIGNTLKTLAPVFKTIGDLFNQIMTSIGSALAPLVVALANAFSQILTALAPLVPIFAQLFLDIIQKVLVPLMPTVVALIGIFASVISQVLVAITPLIPLFTNLFIMIIQQIIMPLLPSLVVLIQLLAQVIVMVVQAITPLVPLLVPLVETLVSSLAPVLPQLVDLFIQLVQAILPLLPPLLDLITILLPPLVAILILVIKVNIQFFTVLSTIGVAALTAIISVIGRVVDVLVVLHNGFNTALRVVANAVTGMANAVSTKIGEVVGYFRGLPGQVTSAVGNLGGALVSSGKSLIEGLIKGIKDKFGDVKATLGDLTSKLTSWKGPSSLDKVLLSKNGKIIIGGFIKGLESQYGNVRQSLQGLTSDISLPIDDLQSALSSRLSLSSSNTTQPSNTSNLSIYGNINIRNGQEQNDFLNMNKIVNEQLNASRGMAI